MNLPLWFLAWLVASVAGGIAGAFIYDHYISPWAWRRRALKYVRSVLGPIKAETKPHRRTIRKH